MLRLLTWLGITRWYAKLPHAMLQLLLLGLAAAFALNLVLPDPIPLIDEGVLAFLLLGALRERGARKELVQVNPGEVRDRSGLSDQDRGWQEGDEAGDAPATPPEVLPPSLTSLPRSARELLRLVERLCKAGHACLNPALLSPLLDLADGLHKELRSHEVFLARRDHDPWFQRSKRQQLQRDLARASSTGRTRRIRRLHRQLDRLQLQQGKVEERLAVRQDAIDRALSLRVAIDRMDADLRAFEAGRLQPEEWSVQTLDEVPAALIRFVRRAQELRRAEREVEGSLRAGVLQDQSPARPLASQSPAAPGTGAGGAEHESS